jgi:hypothetical protein
MKLVDNEIINTTIQKLVHPISVFFGFDDWGNV